MPVTPYFSTENFLGSPFICQFSQKKTPKKMCFQGFHVILFLLRVKIQNCVSFRLKISEPVTVFKQQCHNELKVINICSPFST